MTGPLILVERDGSRERVEMPRPDPPESDYIVKRSMTRRQEYHYTGMDGEVPVYVAGGHLQ